MPKILAAENKIARENQPTVVNDFPSNNKALIIVRKPECIAYFNFFWSTLNVNAVLFNTVLSYKWTMLLKRIKCFLVD